jgi:hypothetical protein
MGLVRGAAPFDGAETIAKLTACYFVVLCDAFTTTCQKKLDNSELG